MDLTPKFHPEAADSLNKRAAAILSTIEFLPQYAENRQRAPSEIHPAHEFTDENTILEPYFYEVDNLGNPIGLVLWCNGRHMGWIGDSFPALRDLVEQISRKPPVRDVASYRFILDRLSNWLLGANEQERLPNFADYLIEQLSQETKDYEIWIPLYRVQATQPFQIRQVTFQMVSKQMFDAYQATIPPNRADRDDILELFHKMRSKWQGYLAATIQVRGERLMAEEKAAIEAKNATALLTFLSGSNLDSKSSHCNVLLGSQHIITRTTFFVDKGLMASPSERLITRQGGIFRVDPSSDIGTLIAALHDLALNVGTGLRRDIFDALILYSRQAQATELSDKLVFALSALESVLLKNDSELIQVNLAERMAFLIGRSVDDRQKIIKNIKSVYRIRSAFVHHGQAPRHQRELDEFLQYAWNTLYALLKSRDKFATKSDLVDALERRKLA